MTTRVKGARIYVRVSTDEQDVTRQLALRQSAEAAGYYVAKIYGEKASGARVDRPALLDMIHDLQPGEVVIAEKIDRISRLPLEEAEKLIDAIRAKGAKLAVPGIVDFSDLIETADTTTRIVMTAMQDMLLKLALQMARDDYETRRVRQAQGIQLAKAARKYKGRRPDIAVHKRVIALRTGGHTIHKTAELAGCSPAQVKRIWAAHQTKGAE